MNVPVNTEHSLRRTSLHQELADKVRELIVTGELRSGKKVPERELCEMFGVSRTPLREALKVLAADQLVVLQPNRGAWVNEITVEALEEVFPVMGALEALSGELACEKITDEEIDTICKLHEAMVGHYKARRMMEYFEVNQEIHEAILAAARNQTLNLQYRSLATQVRRARYLANMTDARWKQAIEEHEAIVSCLKARDGKGLAEVLREHLRNKLETVRCWLVANS